MKNYAVLVAKLQSRNSSLLQNYFAASAICSVCVKTFAATRGNRHNFNMAMDQKNTNGSLHGCIFAMKHFSEKSFGSQANYFMSSVATCKKFQYHAIAKIGQPLTHTNNYPN